MLSEKFTVGILIEDHAVPAWEYDMLMELLQANYVSKVILFSNSAPSPHKKNQTARSLAFRLFNRFEKRWFKNLADASCILNLDELQGKYPNLGISGNGLDDAEIPPVDLVYISYLRKDKSFVSIPRYGLWYIQFGNEQRAIFGMPGFWEVVNNEVITQSSLKVVIGGEGNEIVAYQAVSQTVPFSVINNFNSIAWKASRFFPIRLKKLYLMGPEKFFTQPEIPADENKRIQQRNNDSIPSNSMMIWYFIRNCFRYALNKVMELINKNDRFIILFRKGELDFKNLEINLFTKLIPEGKNFWADPFIFENQDGRYVFFEEGVYPGFKGRICAIQINPEGTVGRSQIALEKTYHLSYPFVFVYNNKTYLIPESSENLTVDLYECKKMPAEWVFCRNLMSGTALQDPTLFYHDGFWWLFGTTKMSKYSTSNDQLVIYYSDDLFSEAWTAHPGNPVVTDVSNCRPAGKIVKRGDKIFRPAQNNASKQYGFSVRINEIELLTTTEFKEKPVFEISPLEYKGFKAIHTINTDANLVVIDGILS